MPNLARYTVEFSRPEGGWADLEQTSARARNAAGEMQAEGMPVRFLRSIYVPEDDTCFFLYEGPTAAAVRDAVGRARLAPRRVRETIPEVEE
jgi:hypothetical protein